MSKLPLQDRRDVRTPMLGQRGQLRALPTDPGFAEHPAHGLEAQRTYVQRVMPYVKNRRLAIDAGAHIGLWSKLLVDAGFKYVHAFEPVPDTYRALEENAVRKRVIPHAVALGAVAGHCRMAAPADGNSGMRYVIGHGTPNASQWPVAQMRTIDSYGFFDVDLIKIDVEGFEGEVIAGAGDTIERWSPTIVFEDNGVGEKYYGASWKDPKLLLEKLGYAKKLRYRKDEVWTRA